MSSGIQYGNSIINDGLVFYVDTFKDINGINSNYLPTGSIWYDLSRNTGDMIISGALYNTTDNGYFTFSFGNTGVGNSSAPNVGLSGSVTIEFFAKVTSTGGLSSTSTLILCGSPGNNTDSFSYGILIDAVDGSQIFRPAIAAGSTESGVINTIALNTNIGSWGCYTITFSSSPSLNKVYLNGGASTATNPRYTATPGGSTIYIARPALLSAAGRFLRRAQVGSIKIWNKVLSDNEILRSYNSTKNRYGL